MNLLFLTRLRSLLQRTTGASGTGPQRTYHESLELFWSTVVLATVAGICISGLIGFGMLFVPPASGADRVLSKEEDFLPQQNNEYNVKAAAAVVEAYAGRTKLMHAENTEESTQKTTPETGESTSTSTSSDTDTNSTTPASATAALLDTSPKKK